MADLNDKDSAQTVKLVGADPTTGIESTYVQANALGELITAPKNSYFNQAGAATSTIKSGAGRLHTVAVNATANGTLIIYDNTTAAGTRIATCSFSNGVSNPTLIYDVEFSTGLTIVTTGANLNITVSYR